MGGGEIDWDVVSELIQSGEAQTFGGLEIGGLLYTPHKTYGCTITNDTYHKKQGYLTLRIMGFDFEEVSYKDNPNGNPLHSMTLWSEFNLGNKQFCPAEKPYALTEDTVFHKEYELELIVTATGEGVKNNKAVNSDDYIPFFIYDKTKTGYNRIWRSYYGKHKITFNNTSQKWEVIQIGDGQVIYSSKDNSLEPFDNLEIINDNIDITNPDNFKWEKVGEKYIVLNKNKQYYIKSVIENTNVYTIDSSIVDNTFIPDDVEYYEINPDKNGVRSVYNSTEVSLNSRCRSNYGNNCWMESPIRKYLNSDKNNGEWYSKGNIWSNTPTYINEDGFLKGFTDEKFLNHLATVKNYTERAYTSLGGGYDITYDKVYLPSRGNLGFFNTADRGIRKLYNCDIDGNFEVGTKHGTYFPYLRNIYISDNETNMYNNTPLNAVRKKMNFNDSSYTYSWMRSPAIGFIANLWFIHVNGKLYNYDIYAYLTKSSFAPLFTII